MYTPQKLFHTLHQGAVLVQTKSIHSAQGCALAEPGGPWCLTLPLGAYKILDFSYKSYAGHPRS